MGGADQRAGETETDAERTLSDFTSRLRAEWTAAYEASPFSELSRDCFSRFWRDPKAKAAGDEAVVDEAWSIVVPDDAGPLVRLMAEHLRDFLARRMDTVLDCRPVLRREGPDDQGPVIVLDPTGGPDGAGEFRIDVAPDRIDVTGAGEAALRDGVVRLVDRMGLRRAPFLRVGSTTYRPRLPVRLGAIPHLGSIRDAVFLGYNALTIGWYDFYELSSSDALPELARFRAPNCLKRLGQRVAEAGQYALKTYAHIELRKLPGDDPVFEAHPDLRGALTWKPDGEYVVCTEHPLMQCYIWETSAGIFRAVPGLTGIIVIIGGESFYHCFMRPYDHPKGHTSCPRCEPPGPDAVVANLVNRLVAGARDAKPDAEVLAWPYSASGAWSDDAAQIPFIERLDTGASLFTEMEKEEYVTTPPPECVRKHLWDYSIHLIGPSARAARQIETCTRRGIAVHVKSEAELGLDLPGLPHVPCLDRWIRRAEAMAACGATGAWVFPIFRPLYASSAAEVFKHCWWTPVPDPEEVLQLLAARIAGPEAGPSLRRAWGYVSEAIDYSPEIPPYYAGPSYLGPAHPMCCDPHAELPEVFFGRYLFLAEIAFDEGMKLKPTFLTSPGGNHPRAFRRCHERMADLLARADDEIDAAEPLVPPACRLPFAAEASSIRWFFRTARTHVNFFRSCEYRSLFFPDPEIPDPRRSDRDRDDQLIEQWRSVLIDERDNAREALPLMEADVRLDFHYGGDHCFAHGADMIRAKLDLIDDEINRVLPAIASRAL